MSGINDLVEVQDKLSHNDVALPTYSVNEIVAHVRLIQDVLHNVMKENQHYGVIPGTKNPTLLKAGAEKILETFRLAPDIEVFDKSGENDVTYRVKVVLKHQVTGAFIGSGIGECSSKEEKYSWKTVFDDEWNESLEDNRRTKKGKKQVRVNPADVANTVLKMAKKRALVDATLTATAASDIFTQDVEETAEPEVEKPSLASKSPLAENKISEAQGKRFYAIAKSSGKCDATIKGYLLEKYNLTSTRDITKEIYYDLCKWAATLQLGE